MAVTKILARKGRLDVGVRYVLNGDKTQEQILTARLNCEPDREVRQMLETKRDYGKEDGVQYYHMIQSFRPGEITPELALEIAKEFAVTRQSSASMWTRSTSRPTSFSIPSTRTPARSITATLRATTGRSGTSQTGCAGNMASL